VVEDDESPFYPIYKVSTLDIVKKIDECFSYEYYLIPKDKKWFICETHHNSIVGIGSEFISSIEAAHKKTVGSRVRPYQYNDCKSPNKVESKYWKTS
jgi:hypothetical protein